MAAMANGLAHAVKYIRNAPHQQVSLVLDLIEELEVEVMQFNAADLSKWIDNLMDMSSKDRKMLSYDGALRCRCAHTGEYIDNADWIDPHTDVAYFDPTNRVYAIAIHYLCLYAPDGAQICYENWNKEKVGDIMECAFAIAYRKPSPENIDFRDHLERVCYAVMKLDGVFPGPHDVRLWATTVEELRVFLLRLLKA